MRLAAIYRSVAGLLILLLLFPGTSGLADDGPDRKVIEQVKRTAYIWVVGAWNFETCRILTDDIEDVPQYADIATLCGIKSTSLINSGAANLYYLGKYEYLEDQEILLPEIIVKTDYLGSSVIVQALDPLPGQKITRIEATINGAPVVCDESIDGVPGPAGSLTCKFPINNLPVLFSVFAVSTYGDYSKSNELRIGKSTQSNYYFTDPEKKVVIIGDSAYAQYNSYHDIPRRWGLIPGDDFPPGWLNIVPVETLESDQYYYYLAGQILLAGVLTANNCPNRGISGQYATNCGVHAVFDAVYQYQNGYNAAITAAGDLYGVPNALIKRIVAVESQFWPGALGIAGENGLYQFTRDGADTLLRWNGPAYLDLCGLYFDNCITMGYDNLAAWQRNVLISHVLADPNNLDYLAAALKANAYQVDRLLSNILGVDHAGGVLNYIDLWKITISNYHTGATVTAAVFQQIDELNLPVNWVSFAVVLERVQPSGLNYVNQVTRGY